MRNIQNHFGAELVSLHTMDNYYLDSDHQYVDDQGYKNFDLPTSFQKQKFCADLDILRSGVDIEIPIYDFKSESGTDSIHIKSNKVILVEGLFIYHYDMIMSHLDYKVMVQLPLELAYARRLKRDIAERDYTEEITKYRYFNHVEPAYKKFIDPYISKMDLLVDNTKDLSQGEATLKEIIKKVL